MNKILFCSLLLVIGFYHPVHAQLDSISSKTDTLGIKVVDGAIELQELDFHLLPDFNNQLDRDYYFWLQKKVKFVWPYYLDAVKEYRKIQEELKHEQSKKGAKKLVKSRQKDLTAAYEQKLKSLSMTEGKILALLIHRKTGKTVFDIIKELKGGWSAFWWNVKADIFDIDLKKGFEPKKYRMDAFIDVIVKKNIAEGTLTDLP